MQQHTDWSEQKVVSQQGSSPSEQVVAPLKKHSSPEIHIILIYLVLTLATLIAFEHVRHCEFVYDDILFITRNPHVSGGINSHSVVWAFTDYISYWHPLTWLSHMLDCQLFGVNPGWHHLTNLLLHTINTLLLFGLLKQMTGSLWRSAFVAAAFALHPLHVESVAWVSERKDVLSSLFFMLTIAAYLCYIKRPGITRYLLTLLVFALGLMAKPMVVTLPFVLLLLDYWPLGRLHFSKSGAHRNPNTYKSSMFGYQGGAVFRLVLEKLPFIVLSALSIYLTSLSTRLLGIIVSDQSVPMKLRVANALVSYVKYIGKMVWPQNLAVLYPYPHTMPIWQTAGALLLLICVSVLVILVSKRKAYLGIGWLWYLGTLVPVIGLVQVGQWPAMADRYTYLPSIGLFIMAAWGAAELASRWRPLKIALGISACIVLTVLMFCTRVQVKYWRNNLTLFEHALAVTENNPVMLHNVGSVFKSQGKPDEAVNYYRQALQLKPNYYDAHSNLAITLATQGNLDEAIAHFHQALKIKPDHFNAYNNLGIALAAQGNLDDAISCFHKVLQLMPNFAEAHYNLGRAFGSQGKLSKAVSNYRQALQLMPDHLASLSGLARILATDPESDSHDPADAIRLAERAAKLTKRQNATILETLAIAYAAAGYFDQAASTAKEAIALASLAKNENLANHIKKQLELYKQEKPYTEPVQGDEALLNN